jgi:hypothetical protein
MDAATASAFTNFTSESAPAKVTGTQTTAVKITTNAGSISCNGGAFNGESSATSTTILQTSISYSGCTFLGVFGIVINPNGCNFVYHASGTLDISCPVGAAITFSAVGCTTTIFPQTGLGTVSYENQGTGPTREVRVTQNISKVTTHTSTGCPGGGTVHSTTTTITGGTVVRTGENSKGTHIGLLTS